jgi:prepilin-type N-terminal cleavage/methylation domain-containing protein
MQRKGFSILEIMVALVIVGVLATIGFPMYRGMVEDGKAKLCETNLRALKSALDVYVVEHNVVPGALSMVPREDIDSAYARLEQGKGGWKVRLASWIVAADESAMAYADFLQDLAAGNLKILSCPANKAGGTSYGVFEGIKGLTADSYKALPAETIVLGDCSSPTFKSAGELDRRHIQPQIIKSKLYALAITAGGKVVAPGLPNNVPPKGIMSGSNIGGSVVCPNSSAECAKAISDCEKGGNRQGCIELYKGCEYCKGIK